MKVQLATCDSDQSIQCYSAQDNRTWRAMRETLLPLQDSHACQAYLSQRAELLGVADHFNVPQPSEVAEALIKKTGFRVVPATGTVPGGDFFANLKRRRFTAFPVVRPLDELKFCSQPDWLHEYLGHATWLGNTQLADLYQLFGDAASRAKDKKQIRILGRLYWYICEVGLVREQGNVKAFGAAILSSISEIANYSEARQVPFDLKEIAATPYDYGKNVQPTYFVAESAEQLLEATRSFLVHFPESYHE